MTLTSIENGFRHDGTDTSPGDGAPPAVAGGTPGKRIPDADLTMSFEVVGQERLLAVASADLTDTTPVTANEVKLYQGRAIAVVRSGADPGRITVRGTATGAAPAEVTIAVER